MSSTRALTAMARSRALYSPILTTATRSSIAAAFSTTPRRRATTEGPPPANFRLPKPERWNEKKESLLDQAGNYFLLTEMMRGMYVVLEQFFRPPYGTPRLPHPSDLTSS